MQLRVTFNQQNGLSEMLCKFDFFFPSSELTMHNSSLFYLTFFPKSTCRNDTIGNQCEKRIHAIVNNTPTYYMFFVSILHDLPLRKC